jgi:agmatine deiminase
MNSILKDLENISTFVFPFEGEKHLATVVAVPYREDTWRKNATFAVENYLEVVKAISQFEMVVVIVDPRLDASLCARFQMKNTHILRLRYDDAWTRDSLPVFLEDKENKRLVGVDFGFNAWGGKVDGLYKDYEDDNALGKNTLLELMIHRYADKDFILEGGSIHTDGQGTLITTEECLLSKGRNPSMSKNEIEERLKKDLNIKKVLWLPYGIYEDETNGHVDNICCFLKPGVVALAETDDVNDPQYERSKKDREYLESVTDAAGNPLTIISLPLPKPQYMTKEEAESIIKEDSAIQREEGRRLAASYVNFYMGRDFIILPQFNDDNDKKAYDILNDFYKGTKTILPIHSREILLGGGNIHCITKQIPFMELGYDIEPKEGDK